MKPFIGYHFFHGVGRIAPSEAYSRTERAMNTFTDQKTPSYHGFILDMRDDQGGPLESLFEDLCRKFGPVSSTTKSISGDRAPTYRAHRWTLSDQQFGDSFSLLKSVHKEIPAARTRTHIQASWHFKFVQPETGALLPDQENMPEIDIRLGRGSSLNLTTGEKTSVNAWFLFPFEKASQDFDEYVHEFQEQLIFKFSPKHWRLWKFYPVRGWSPRKIVPSWYASSGAS
jgi:hypothetical protein